MHYWLVKTEPSECSIDSLASVTAEPWTGVRNYTARNFMRDAMKIGDLVFIYHSSIANPEIAGIATVNSDPYPDPTQFDRNSEYFDAKSSLSAPRWILVDLRYKRHAKNPLSLKTLRNHPQLHKLQAIQRGNRLSITPVSREDATAILALLG